MAIVAFLGIIRIDQYPATWFDEGSYLEVSRNIAESRLYAVQSADGTLDYAPVLSVGPTVLLPVAGTIRIGGNSLEAARAVAAAFTIVASFMYFRSLRSLAGSTAALIGVAMLLTMPAIRWLMQGRQVAGEVPSVLFLIGGAAIAFKARSFWMTGAAGLVLGLAIVTKPQYLTLLPLTILIVALIDTSTHRARSIRWYATLLAGLALPPLLWAITLVQIIGLGHIHEQVEILRQTGNATLLTFDPQHLVQTGWSVLGPAGLFLVLPSGIYGILRARQAGGDRKLTLTAMVVFQTTWLTWFVFMSNGWMRYAFPALVVSTMFIAMMLVDLGRLARNDLRIRFAAYGMFVVVALLIAAGATRTVLPILNDGSSEAQQFAAKLNQHVHETSTVAGWEPEINFLSDHPLTYPPIGSLSEAMRAHAQDEQFTLTLPPLESEYLVVGEFGRLVGIYQQELDDGTYSQVLSVGRYELYQRNN
jgi:4-amino-4-deoxy-L-arabinose transferase-like glycosyltransferase